MARNLKTNINKSDMIKNTNLSLLSCHLKFLNFKANIGISATNK